MNRRLTRALTAGAAVFATLTPIVAACAADPAADQPTPLRAAADQCIEDEHDAVEYNQEDDILTMRGVVVVDHPDADRRLQTVEAYCIQDELDAPTDQHILDPSDIDQRAAYEWDGYRVSVAQVSDGDGQIVDIIFYGAPADR